jgi:uncharacterized phiE125 gp8 family phage protein
MAWAPDYATSAELKAYVRIGDNDDDAQVALAVTAASRAIDRACNRQFGQTSTAEDRYYTATWNRKHCWWMVRIDDLMTTDGLTIHYDSEGDQTYTGEIDEYLLLPRNSAVEGRPWTALVALPSSTTTPGDIESAVRVHGTFGWSSVPSTIKQAVLLQASRFLARRDSPFGVAGSPDIGSEMRLLAKLDPDVALAVRPYYRWWGAV